LELYKHTINSLLPYDQSITDESLANLVVCEPGKVACSTNICPNCKDDNGWDKGVTSLNRLLEEVPEDEGIEYCMIDNFDAERDQYQPQFSIKADFIQVPQ